MRRSPVHCGYRVAWPVLAAMLLGCGASSQTDVPSADSVATVTAQPDATESDPPNPSGPAVPAPEVPAASGPATMDRQQQLDRADELAASQDHAGATAILRQLLISDPDDVEVLFRLANVSAAADDLSTAITLLEAIPEENLEAGLPALGQAADWCFELQRYDLAEQKYRRLLQLAPDATRARRQLAYLLNRQGRRHEAAQQIRQLCRQGDVSQDELSALIVLTDAMYDDPQTAAAVGVRPYWPIGSAGRARRLFNQQRYAEAMQILHDDVHSGQAPAAVRALYGRAAAEAQDDPRLQQWLAQEDEAIKEQAEYWAAVGTYLLSERRFEQATRALAEAVDRDSTDLISLGRLRQAVLALGDDAMGEKLRQRWLATRDSLRANNRVADTADPDAIAELAERLLALDRKLEAVLWKSIEQNHRGAPRAVIEQLNQQRQTLVATDTAFPSREDRLCGLELQRFAVPQLNLAAVNANSDQTNPAPADQPSVIARFENVAAQIDLQSSFAVASQPQAAGFAIYQFFGGAVVVLDYDLDGAVDLYFGQGAADPPSFRGQQSNQLYRNVDQHLIDVTADAGTSETRYTTGVTAGDWNQDGFPDLFISNLGGDVLLINQGDGCYRSQPLTAPDRPTRVPTSVAMGDLTGDGLPDLFQLSYVDDERLTQRPLQNADGQVVAALTPTDFHPGADRWWVNDGRGGPQHQIWDSENRHRAAGLGLVVTDLDGKPGNEIFIGNDLYPNQWWQRDRSTGAWSEVAAVLGCGFGYTGGATASMGIASGDFDGNGTLDLHITNYQKEACSLYLQDDQGAYRDRNLQYRLNADSRAVLGFGTQAIDFDHDGRLDLAVTNGHVDKEAGSTDPYEQPPQLFHNRGSHFERVDVQDRSGYWSAQHLGRSMARLDFNRDGKLDLAITHLQSPASLLINQTETDHHWLQLELVGVDSERDAIGACVEVQTGDRRQRQWQTAGDGYFCRNEPVLEWGLGQSRRIDRLTITWPSGRQQDWTDVAVDQRLLVVENQPSPYPLPTLQPSPRPPQ